MLGLQSFRKSGDDKILFENCSYLIHELVIAECQPEHFLMLPTTIFSLMLIYWQESTNDENVYSKVITVHWRKNTDSGWLGKRLENDSAVKVIKNKGGRPH